jgi:1,2-diacylglycerol 3-beta-glucosyltransferase
MVLLTVLLGACAAVLLAPLVSDVLSLVHIVLRRCPPATAPPLERARLLVLVPAHNEELLLGDCLMSLAAMRYPRDRHRVVVIADNCSDATADRARAAGVSCLERREPSRPGKPQAIAWALVRLPLEQFDAVVIVDADTLVDAGFAAELSALGSLRARAAQGYFGLSNPDESPITRMSAVLASATHAFAYRLKGRAGLNVPLVGNGMVIGTEVLARHGWHAFSICEDWEMYGLLTAAGVTIVGAPRARLYAQEARSLSDSWTQRQRWTAGRLNVLARVGLPLFTSPRIGARQKLDALAELAAPGPALHVAAVMLLGAASAALRPPGTVWLLTGLAASLLRPGLYTAAALAADRQAFRAATAFWFLPVYAIWRMASVLRALRLLRGGRWVRTQRHVHGGT